MIAGTKSPAGLVPHSESRPLMKLAISMAVVALTIASTNARADFIADCNDGANTARQIHACTRVIGRTMMSENLAIAYMNRGIANAERREPQKALEDFSASINANPANGIAYYNRGNVYFDLQKFQRASDDYSKAIELEPDLTLALLNRAMAKEKLGNQVVSTMDYRAALALDPTLFEASAGLKRLEVLP